jgi:hypothetical protein
MDMGPAAARQHLAAVGGISFEISAVMILADPLHGPQKCLCPNPCGKGQVLRILPFQLKSALADFLYLIVSAKRRFIILWPL